MIVIAGLKLITVHPGLYRVPDTFLYLSYIQGQGWWISYNSKPQHRKPYQSMVEACTILGAIIQG